MGVFSSTVQRHKDYGKTQLVEIGSTAREQRPEEDLEEDAVRPPRLLIRGQIQPPSIQA